MARSDKDDPKLSEVKAVLQRLQGLSADATGPQSASTGRRPVRPAVIAAIATMLSLTAAGIFGVVALFLDSHGVTDSAPGSSARITAGKPAATTSAPSSSPDQATTRMTAVPQTPPEAMEPAAASPSPRRINPPAPEAKTGLEAARGLMAKGRVRAAREQLLGLAANGSPDAAWDLARSYDPNVLAALPTADATADVKEATRWYRAWYTAAVRDGLVADSVSLERIIGSMRR